MADFDASDVGDASTVDSLLREVAAAAPRVSPTIGPGATLGPYALRGPLGRGGMGVVFTAVDTRLGREVALKLVPGGAAGDRGRARFLREARAAAAVSHANVATIYEVGEIDGQAFIAMERVPGRSLRARLGDGRLAPAFALDLGRQIARGLAAAHGSGVVHRDLKPENVIVTPAGCAKVVDFGLAKVAPTAADPPGAADETTVTREGVVMGTPAYMAPEQAAGQATDARVDVYAFGVVLHELLTGARPTVLGAAPLAPPELAAIVRRCVAADPAQRFPSGVELAAALEAVPEPARKGRRRAALAVPVLGVAAIGLVLGAHGRDPGAEPPPPPPPAAAATAVPFGGLHADSTDPEALAEYRRAMASLRDATGEVHEHLRRAIARDADFAAAHLRFAIVSLSPAHYREAVRTRARLDPHDAQLLDAVAPLFAEPADQAEAVRRFRAVAAETPRDAEALLYAAVFADPGEALAAARALAAADPGAPRAELQLGVAAAAANDLATAAPHFEACLRAVPTATACARSLAELRGARGDCDGYLDGLHRALTLAPGDAGTHTELVSVSLGMERDETADAELAVMRRLAPQDEAMQAGVAIMGVERALVRGDFDGARRAFDGLADALPASEKVGWLVGVTGASERIAIAEETGEDPAPLLRTYVARRATTAAASAEDAYVLPLLARGIGVAPAEGARLGAAWRAAAALPPVPPPYFLPLEYDAPFVRTAAEATALLARPELADVPARLSPFDGLALGRLLVLAGRPAEARPRFEAAAGWCTALDSGVSNTASRMRAVLELGRLAEAGGDTAGACAAYGRVVARWGEARPRSLTADAARTAATRLRCPGLRPR